MRLVVFTRAIFLSLAILVGILFYTQIVRHELYRELSEQNRIRILPLEAPRGKIYDRKGRILVSNRIAFDAQIVYQEVKDRDKVARELGDILGINKRELSKKINEACRMPFAPVKIAEDINKDKAIRIEEIRRDLPGIIVTTRPMRSYLYGKALCHVIGYLGKISEEELERYRGYGYRMQDFVGKDGIEKSYNDYLKGTDGGLQIEVDSKGRQLKVLAIKEPRPGKDLYLNIDGELQEFCQALLAEKSGAIVAMDPSTGAVLALVSHPDFDPNIFVMPDNIKVISGILNNRKESPLLNRAIGGTYPLGSVFKVIVAAAALDSHGITDKKTFFCNGSYSVGNRLFICWKEEGHGVQNVTEAIKNSCNVFFYQLALFTGADTISKYAFKFGLGKPTGIDLAGEAGGFVPTESWKRRKFGTAWFKGETANFGIGQGYLLVTPIQVTHFIGAIANEGILVKPFVVNRIEDIILHHAVNQDVEVTAETISVLRNGMRKVVNEEHGTGMFAKSKDIVIAGKTGTAQNPKGKPHAWFAGFAPFENPKICVTVFIEHGGKGGLEPARFARKIIEKARALELL